MQIARKIKKRVHDETKRASIRSGAACACERRGAACDDEESGGRRGGVRKDTKTVKVQSDVDILNQIGEGKKVSCKVRDFEDLAKELGI